MTDDFVANKTSTFSHYSKPGSKPEPGERRRISVTDTEKLAAEFPHIDALSRGCMSGKPTDWPQFQPECARIMDRFSLAMEAIEAADKAVRAMLLYTPREHDGAIRCNCCYKHLHEVGVSSHRPGCEVRLYLELRKKLEEMK